MNRGNYTSRCLPVFAKVLTFPSLALIAGYLMLLLLCDVDITFNLIASIKVGLKRDEEQISEIETFWCFRICDFVTSAVFIS